MYFVLLKGVILIDRKCVAYRSTVQQQNHVLVQNLKQVAQKRSSDNLEALAYRSHLTFPFCVLYRYFFFPQLIFFQKGAVRRRRMPSPMSITKESGYGHENVNVWEIHYSMYHIASYVIRTNDVWRSPYGVVKLWRYNPGPTVWIYRGLYNDLL